MKHLGVRFLYTEVEERVAAAKRDDLGADQLDIEQLKKLPPDLIKELREGIVLLDEDYCFKAIGVISDHDHELGVRLRRMVEDLQYKSILAILDNLTEGGTQ